ncbi:rRNA maturation RNase YbeY [Sunxiuqinia elliptica]|uniref:Endoribonuclease YbeY n=1 Tax=Sunxiuqinia elliptica TaxID=655355 RepID=A0A4R6GZZ7_9BACT|nr:rRNA maturation RNase YbeY [Sunxiuqinia elliptica]TDO01272.1 rRNA maturation RNase YbeY [Sunxiuqinia elliptica]TDO57783.1 rRNA maturation RNase YbeY [Sunxiuqinia elliptica]
MSINFYFEDIEEFQLDQPKTIEWIKNSIQKEGKNTSEISFIFCSDDYLLDINRQYLDHDYYTDIITFDYVEGDDVSGDVFISIDRVRENAETFQVSFQNELNRIIIHGVLHLLGYKDKEADEKKIMTGKEDYYLGDY